MAEEKHIMRLGYDIYDDGVHLSCTCGFDQNLGFNASPEDVTAAAAAHLRSTFPGREEWGVMFGDGSVTHSWNGRTMRQRAEEERRRLAETYHPDQFWLCRRANRNSPWEVVGDASDT